MNSLADGNEQVQMQKGRRIRNRHFLPSIYANTTCIDWIIQDVLNIACIWWTNMTRVLYIAFMHEIGNYRFPVYIEILLSLKLATEICLFCFGCFLAGTCACYYWHIFSICTAIFKWPRKYPHFIRIEQRNSPKFYIFCCWLLSEWITFPRSRI